MPIALSSATLATGTVIERMRAFRKGIKRGEAWTAEEVAHAIGAHHVNVRSLMKANGWGINILGARNMVTRVLVNPLDEPKPDAAKAPRSR